MLDEKDKETLLAAALVIRTEAKWYYDAYRRESDGIGSGSRGREIKAYEKVGHYCFR
jgi:hypothetical protein